jgi:hypothetical protein
LLLEGVSPAKNGHKALHYMRMDDPSTVGAFRSPIFEPLHIVRTGGRAAVRALQGQARARRGGLLRFLRGGFQAGREFICQRGLIEAA